MERLAEAVQALPKNKLPVSAQHLLAGVVPSAPATLLLHSSLQALLSLLCEDQFEACQKALISAGDLISRISAAASNDKTALLEQP